MKNLLRRHLRAGYTMVEVMMGLSILAIGASSIIALQRFSVMGTATSRHITNATNVTASVLETLNVESNSWTANTGADEAAMPWLGRTLNQATVPAGAWQKPANGLYGFTLDGMPVDPSSGAVVAYCTHVRGMLLGPVSETAPGLNDQADSIRVEARTFYARSGRDIAAECNAWAANQVTGMFNSPGTLQAVPGQPSRRREEYGVIYLSTIIRRPR
ncbi:MAG: prepilin-type N-terminal cleavage/methylation domain-containing protein [Polyangiaceae bacterium]